MKRILTTTILIAFTAWYAALANNSSSANTNYESYYNLVNNEDTSEITIADSKILVLENDSSVSIKLLENTVDSTNSSTKYENVNVEIVENNQGTKFIVHKEGDTVQHFEVNFDEFSQNDTNADTDSKKSNNNKTFTFNKKSKKQRFKGHWSGFEFGLNNYLTNDMSISPDEAYMELNTSKSWNYNLNFAQVSLPIYQDRVGIVSGLGFEWSNYHFSNENSIRKDTGNRTITSKDLSGLALKKNRLQTTYLTAPILLEAQIGGNNSKRIAISGGLIAGLKIGSHTKYKTSDNKQKDKDDFYLNSFRYGVTARVHYDDIGLYFNYYNTPLFMNDRGPELYPFAAGLIVSFD